MPLVMAIIFLVAFIGVIVYCELTRIGRGKVMPYKEKAQDRQWHKIKMRERRARLKLEGRFVTPSVTPQLDADGNIIPW